MAEKIELQEVDTAVEQEKLLKNPEVAIAQPSQWVPDCKRQVTALAETAPILERAFPRERKPPDSDDEEEPMYERCRVPALEEAPVLEPPDSDDEEEPMYERRRSPALEEVPVLELIERPDIQFSECRAMAPLAERAPILEIAYPLESEWRAMAPLAEIAYPPERELCRAPDEIPVDEYDAMSAPLAERAPILEIAYPLESEQRRRAPALDEMPVLEEAHVPIGEGQEPLVQVRNLDDVDAQKGFKDPAKVKDTQENETIAEEFEEKLNRTLDDGDIDEITDIVTPYGLGKCTVNCLEKAMEVSSKLYQLGQKNGPNAADLTKLGKSVEDFSVQLIEPLKGDDMKRAIFGGKDFDRISDEAVQFEQKKFISHPVVYSLLIRRWTGDFWSIRFSSFMTEDWWKWILLNIWTVFDLVLFPVVFAVLFLIHKMVGILKKRKDYRVVFLLNASWKFKNTDFKTMRYITEMITKVFKPGNVNYAAVLHNGENPITCDFDDSDDAEEFIDGLFNRSSLPWDISDISALSATHEDESGSLTEGKRKRQSHMCSILPALRKAVDIFYDKFANSDKVLVVLTDDKCGVPRDQLSEAIESLKKMDIRIIPVGVGVNPEIKELETMATFDKDIVLLPDRIDPEKVSKTIMDSIYGEDVFDHYFNYFTTPYFIFVRDTLSYLVLLGLHFAICLQRSTRYFTVTEWIIVFFFLGRLMMEIHQVVIGDTTTIMSAKHDKRENRDKSKTKLTIQLRKLITKYVSDKWNLLDAVTLVFYLVLLVLRAITWSSRASVSQNRLLAVAGYLYGLNAMLLTLRSFGHIMESKKGTGAIQIALFHIIGAVIAIFGQFLAALMAFSLAITKIYMVERSYNSASNGTSHGFCKEQGISCWWSTATHLTWSLLGIADLGPLESSDVTSDVLAKILYGVFLIMGVVMLMNMMIALLSNTYQQVEDNSFYEWSYKKAITIRTYSTYHPVPVPFNVISLTAKLLYFVYATIRRCNCQWKCTCSCKRKFTNNLPITSLDDDNETPSGDAIRDPIFDRLLTDLQAIYFSVYGYSFPLTDESKMDVVMKETEGNHQIVGHIAKRVFRDDWEERELLQGYPKGKSAWNSEGIKIDGNQLSYLGSEHCIQCLYGERDNHHGARYNEPISPGFPGFEVLIQECGERRFFAIGLVSQNYDLHLFPGWKSNTVGYHIDDGRIFDKADAKSGREGDDAMAHRGDLIGCFVEKFERRGYDDFVPLKVSFTLNGREIGKADLAHDKYSSSKVYPYVALGSKDIIVLVKMRPASAHALSPIAAPSSELQEMSSQLIDLNRNVQTLLDIVHNQDMEIMSLRRDLAQLVDSIRCGTINVENKMDNEEEASNYQPNQM